MSFPGLAMRFHRNLLVTVNSEAAEWTGSTASFSFSTGVCDLTTGGKAIKSADTFTGDFTFRVTCNGNAADTWNSAFGVYPISEDGTFNENIESGGTINMTNSWNINGYDSGSMIRHGGSDLADITGHIQLGDDFEIRRVGSTFKLYKNTSLDYTWAATSAAEVRLIMSGANSASKYEGVSWTS